MPSASESISVPFAQQMDERLNRHISALGLLSISSYKLWCRRHGFPMSLEKSESERESERAFLELQSQPCDPEADPRHDLRRAEYIRRIADGEFDGEPLSDIMSRVRRLYEEVEDVDDGRAVLLNLLIHVERYGNLLIGSPGFDSLGQTQRNLVISGLSQLTRHHQDWIRQLEDWRPPTRVPALQFYDLASHLFCRYPVPRCLNAAWFESDPQEASIQQAWYKHIGSGQNIRTAASLPFKLTKRAAHEFMSSRLPRPPLTALRHAQVIALLGGNRKGIPVWAFSSHEKVRARANADFWTSILHFLLNNPFLERSYIWPLIDYVQHKKFEPRRIPQPDGTVRIDPPEHPNFCIKGRSINKLVHEIDEWHEQLSGEEYSNTQRWDPSGLSGFTLTEDNKDLKARIHWSIHELCNAALLQIEGRIMHHCAGSYARKCVTGEASIWSLRSLVDGADEEEQRHVLTIAVDNKKRQITQARGKFNLQPHGKISNNKQRKTDGPYRTALRESARIMALWRAQEGISYSQN